MPPVSRPCAEFSLAQPAVTLTAIDSPASIFPAVRVLPMQFARVINISALHETFTGPTVKPATPVKRRGKSMSRRTGQSGHIEKSGRWWVVRWWMDEEGQDKRTHMR